jgi:hypothetical protein
LTLTTNFLYIQVYNIIVEDKRQILSLVRYNSDLLEFDEKVSEINIIAGGSVFQEKLTPFALMNTDTRAFSKNKGCPTATRCAFKQAT